MTLFDPFDVVGLVKGRDAKNRFWEEDGIGGPVKIEGVRPAKVESVGPLAEESERGMPV